MRIKRNLGLAAFLMLLGGLFLVPHGVLAKEKGEHWDHQKFSEQVVKELKLSPEKGKEFVAVGEKYAKSRKELFESMKKTRGDLEAALAAPKPDEAKIKELVKAMTGDQDKLLDSFKAQRDEEMALLTAEQQGKFLVTLHKIRMEMYEKHMKKEKEQGEKKEEKK